MKEKRPAAVVFAATLSAARRAADGRPSVLCASPRASSALGRALAESLPVLAVAPPGEKPFWRLAKKRYFLPPAPALLRQAIAGIARRRSADPEPLAGERRARLRAHWIEGDLKDSRARELLKDADCPRLWIVEDFRRLRLSDRMHRRLEEARVELAAFRPLTWRRIATRRRRAP
jgi:hypothetical protein